MPEGSHSREGNCFRCWHCRPVDDMGSCCVCIAFVSKANPPELITEPYGGKCPSFVDKLQIQAEIGGR